MRNASSTVNVLVLWRPTMNPVIFSKYELLKEIGSGTFGKVHLVSSRASGNVYVLKEVHLSSMSAKEKQQALTEVTILSKCKHRNIIRYKEASIEPEKGMLSIVMEYAQCGDLHSVIKNRRGSYFKEQDVLSWFVQITFALQYIHKNNILHRDLKTRNIFLTIENVIKVGDFGIARVLKESQELAKTAIGTPYYLSPEICLRKPYNCKSDMWALGCVLFEMSSLVHPFQANSFHQLVISILNVKYGTLPKQCCTLIKDLVKMLLNSDPEKRPSADEVLAIPMLQPHIARYLRNCSFPTSSCSLESDRQVALAKGAGPRRFSSNDILPTSKIPLAKRRASLSLAHKVSGIAKVWKQASDNPVLSSRCHHLSRVNLLDDRDSQRSVLATTYSKEELNRLSPKSMSGTYTLKKTNPIPSGVEPDLAKDARGGTSSANPSLEGDSKNDAANQEAASPSAGSCPQEPDQCPHAPQCHQCLLQMLWKNRIRRRGCVDQAEKAKLKSRLQAVFGSDAMAAACQALANSWDSSENGNDTLKTVTESLSAEQLQWLPLLLQFVQLELTC